MTPHLPTPDWAVSLMKRITKYDDPDVLDAALEIVTVLGGLNIGEEERIDKRSVDMRADAAQAAVDFGYRKTEDCENHCKQYLSIAV